MIDPSYGPNLPYLFFFIVMFFQQVPPLSSVFLHKKSFQFSCANYIRCCIMGDMRSDAKTVEEYIKSLPDDRRDAIVEIRKVIKNNLPAGYEESMQYGMIGYSVPISKYPAGYLNDKKTPLPYVSLASQKQYISIYLMAIYGDKKAEEWFRKEYEKSGKKLNMGKSCVRARKLEDLPLDVIGKAVALVSPDELISRYEKARKK